MKKLLIYTFVLLLAIAFSGCATWDGLQEDSRDTWEDTKEVSKEAWGKTKDVSSEAWENTKQAVDGK